MEWLAENWLWILLGIGFVWFMSRGHAGLGCCGGHTHGKPQESAQDQAQSESVPTKRTSH